MKADTSKGPLSLKFGGEVKLDVPKPGPRPGPTIRKPSPKPGPKVSPRPKPQPFADMMAMDMGPGPAAAGSDQVDPDRIIKLIKGKKNLRPKPLDKKIKDLVMYEHEDGTRAYFLI